MLGIPYRCVKLARTDKGKPYALSPTDGKTMQSGCNFNISHQGDFVVIAAEQTRQVGVDIMKVEWPRKFFFINYRMVASLISVAALFKLCKLSFV